MERIDFFRILYAIEIIWYCGTLSSPFMYIFREKLAFLRIANIYVF